MERTGKKCDSDTNDRLNFYEQKEELIGILESKWERYGALAKSIRPEEIASPQFNGLFRYSKRMADWSVWGLDVLWKRTCTPERLQMVERTLLAEGVIKKYGDWRGSLVLYV